jgi:hypothetical protein
MANKYKNEMEIELGPEKILLRPSFENMSDTEANVGGIGYLAFTFSRSSASKSIDDSVKQLPPLTMAAKIIYYNQAARKEEDSTLRKFSLEEIWDLVQDEGIKIIKPITNYLSIMTSGNKNPTPISDAEKKS